MKQVIRRYNRPLFVGKDKVVSHASCYLNLESLVVSKQRKRPALFDLLNYLERKVESMNTSGFSFLPCFLEALKPYPVRITGQPALATPVSRLVDVYHAKAIFHFWFLVLRKLPRRLDVPANYEHEKGDYWDSGSSAHNFPSLVASPGRPRWCARPCSGRRPL